MDTPLWSSLFLVKYLRDSTILAMLLEEEEVPARLKPCSGPVATSNQSVWALCSRAIIAPPLPSMTREK